jgi:hypothetical protein
MFVSSARFFPFVTSAVVGELTVADVPHVRAFYDDVLGRKQRFLNLVDARGAQRPDSVVREQLARLTTDLLPLTKELQIANVILLDSRLAAGVMTALRWAVPAPVPEKHFASIEDAFEWLDQRGRPEGVRVTPEAREHARTLRQARVA